jgi:asparagine synthase (glutamine-hydrolysing)
LASSRFTTASELKCLLPIPGLSREVDPESVYHYLSLQFVPPPATILRQVRKLPAGHCFTYELRARHLAIRRWYALFPRPAAGPVLPAEELHASLRAGLSAAIRRWTLSDVPIAISLSGGLDSSLLVALLAASGYAPLRTYSLGFTEDQAEDELALARQVAERYGTQHHEIRLEAGKLLDDLERLVWHLDEPYGGGLPSWYVYEFIGRDCKVALTGTGGDECFGNYGKFRRHLRPWWQRLGVLTRDGLAEGPGALGAAWRWPEGQRFHQYLSDSARRRHWWRGEQPSHWPATAERLEALWRAAKPGDARDGVAAVDFQWQLPEEFLLVTDRFAMAHAVEARTPFLDHEFVEQVFSLPAAVRSPVGDPKGLLRAVGGDLLPAALRQAPKRGFTLPLRAWTRGPLAPQLRDLLSPSALAATPWLQPSLWERVVLPHLEGRRDATQQVWTLFMLQLWLKQHQAGG